MYLSDALIPLHIIRYSRTTLYADLGTQRLIATERDGQKLTVIGTSKIQKLKEALGISQVWRFGN